ncbi:dihydroorotase [Oxyplasma meridianum]|uniref:Dihydroorotase n=1 Tax=Oxyplasma meridianum TaxID=3073602 RepID=A0AAX4NGC0_9ARCH
MENEDLTLSGKFYYKGSYQDLNLAISEGRIQGIRKFIKGRKLELEGAIFPAGTDTHVHFRDPGETQKEDFSSGSMAAAYGGTTTVLDMPNNIIPIDNYQSYERKLESIRGRSFVDFGLYSMFTGTNAEIIHPDSVALKIYMGGSTNTTGMEKLEEKAISSISRLHKPVVFHAEDQHCLDISRRETFTLKDHNMSRPSQCEAIALNAMSKLNIERKIAAHVSDSSNLKFVAGEGTYAEITPHHMILNDEMDLGSYGKVNPPLREPAVQRSNLEAYLSGKYSIVSSDHAPHTPEEKEDLEYAKSGIIGVETRIPILLALVSKKLLSPDLFYRTAILNPAKLFNINKGEIREGSYADFFNVKFSSIHRLNQSKLHSKNWETPFNRMDVVFPENVMMRGNIIVENGEIIYGRTGKYLIDLDK